MSASYIDLTVHESQHPQAVVRELHSSLESRQINPKFLYESHKQTQRWLAVYNTFSPSQTDSGCRFIYEAAFMAVREHLNHRRVVAIAGLGCGSGEKDVNLLRSIRNNVTDLSYFPVDVSPSLTLLARQNVLDLFPDAKCHPLVADLAQAEDLPLWINERIGGNTQQILTYFGMIPNLEPHSLATLPSKLLRAGELMLLSANLAPGDDYLAGVEQVLPQYNNPATREWLLTFLCDLGFEKSDGNLEFVIEPSSPQEPFLRITAWFRLCRNKRIEVFERTFQFSEGEMIRVFYSYRYTLEQLRNLLESCRLTELDHWIAESGEEGVFLFRKYGRADDERKTAPKQFR